MVGAPLATARTPQSAALRALPAVRREERCRAVAACGRRGVRSSRARSSQARSSRCAVVAVRWSRRERSAALARRLEQHAFAGPVAFEGGAPIYCAGAAERSALRRAARDGLGPAGGEGLGDRFAGQSRARRPARRHTTHGWQRGHDRGAGSESARSRLRVSAEQAQRCGRLGGVAAFAGCLPSRLSERQPAPIREP